MMPDSFEPADADFAPRVEASFARQQAMGSLGIALASVGPGRVELTMDYRAQWTQQHGFLHAGVVATALDSACGYAAFSLMPADAAVLTIEFKINLLAPAKGERFRFVGRVIRPGRTITVCQGDAYAVDGGREKTIASMTGTLMAVFGREGIRH